LDNGVFASGNTIMVVQLEDFHEENLELPSRACADGGRSPGVARERLCRAASSGNIRKDISLPTSERTGAILILAVVSVVELKLIMRHILFQLARRRTTIKPPYPNHDGDSSRAFGVA
jgi:hypothetical protein